MKRILILAGLLAMLGCSTTTYVGPQKKAEPCKGKGKKEKVAKQTPFGVRTYCKDTRDYCGVVSLTRVKP